MIKKKKYDVIWTVQVLLWFRVNLANFDVFEHTV